MLAPAIAGSILFGTCNLQLEENMSDSFTNLIYHIVFSTKSRQALINDETKPRLYEYIGGILRNKGGIALAIGGMSDHVHVLAKLRPDDSLSNVLRDLKANSSGWMHQVFPEMKDFAWQRGYGAFTVSASQVRQVSRYIADQEKHHQKHGSFRDEFMKLLVANEIEFDEKYLKI
jgi:putative transposase